MFPETNLPKKIVIKKTTASDPTISKTDPHVNKSITVDLNFSIIDELKKTQASISLFELAKIAQFKNEIVNAIPSRTPKLPQQSISSIDS